MIASHSRRRARRSRTAESCQACVLAPVGRIPPWAAIESNTGGNHAYFGDYGEQEGDGIATITRAEQQTFAVERIVEFILSK